MARTQEMFNIGKITRPHGLRGDVKVIAMTDFPERFETMDSVVVETPDGRLSRYNVLNARPQGDFIILSLEGIDTVEKAERLRGGLLRVTREELYPLPPGHYYLFDLIGLQVYTDAGELLGTVTDVLQPGANDVYVVRLVEGNGECLLPAISDVVKDIDLEAGMMTVHLLPGILED